MPNKKINQLTPRTPSLTDLILVGDPSTGYSYKATLSVMAAFVGSNIQFSSLGGISLTSPSNGQYLTFDGTNWVNTTLTTTNWDTAYNRSLTAASVSGTTTKTLTLTKQDGSTLTATWSDLNTDAVTSVFGRTGVVVASEGDYSLTQLSDVTLISPTNGQVLTYNGIAWVNSASTGGITSINGLSANTQTFATGTNGTDFNISSVTSTHTFNLPTASSTNRGLLSSADWLTFNAKQSAITLTTTGSSGASTFISNTLNIPEYTLSGLGGVPTSRTLTINGTSYDLSADRSWTISAGVTGSGTTNYLSKWTSSTALGNSQIFDNGTSVGINNASPSSTYKLDVSGMQRIVYNDNNFGNGLTILNSNGGTQAIHGILINDSGNNLRGQFAYIPSNFTTAALRSTVIFASVNADKLGFVANSGNFGGTAQDIYFSTLGSNSTYQMQIKGSTGNIQIGSNTDAGYRLDVTGTFRSTLDANINGLTVGKGNGSVATNTALGTSALNAVSGNHNTGIGASALAVTSTGTQNTAVGTYALINNSTASNQTALGYDALSAATTSGNNTAVGNRAGKSTTGASNIFVGDRAGYDVTTGTFNTIIGSVVTAGTLYGITTGSYNTIIGSGITGLSSSLSNTIILADGQGNQRLRIASNGNVLINTTTDAGYKTDINGTLRVQNNSGTSLYVGLSTLVSTTTPALVNLGGSFGSNATGNVGNMKLVLVDVGATNRYGFGVDGNAGVLEFQSTVDFGFYTGNLATRNEVVRIKQNGSVGIGTASPNASSLLDVSSTTKGFLPPRMTSTQRAAISTPAAGLVVYDTTLSKLCVYTTAWETITSA